MNHLKTKLLRNILRSNLNIHNYQKLKILNSKINSIKQEKSRPMMVDYKTSISYKIMSLLTTMKMITKALRRIEMSMFKKQIQTIARKL